MSHGPQHDPHDDDKISSYLAWAQVVVTLVVLGAIGSLAYIAGFTSGKGGHEGKGSEAAPAAAANADVTTLMTPTPELVAEGKSLFAVNCASCHGVGGGGNGAAAVALNPKPRNFTSDQGWKFGRGVARIARTISEGSPGTGMAAFQAIPMPQRIALAHYVRTLNAAPAEDQKADLDWLGVGAHPAGGATTASAAGTTPVAGPTIPIEKALALLTEPAHAVGAITSPSAEDVGEGARLFAARCASCHGSAGQGGVRVRMIGSAPYAYVVTESLGESRGDWALNPATFERHVTQGLTGAMMPGNGDLSRASLRELYLYTQTLRARQEASSRGRSS